MSNDKKKACKAGCKKEFAGTAIGRGLETLLAKALFGCLEAPAAREEKKGADDRDPREFLIRMLLDKSRYDLSGCEIGYRRVPEYDREGAIAFDVFVGRMIEKEDETFVVTEMFPFVAYGDDMARSVREFDEELANSTYFSFDEKRKAEKAPRVSAARKPAKPRKATGSKKAASPRGAKLVPMAVGKLKDILLKLSKYCVSKKRLKVVFDKINRKSGKFEYELRFFQKDYSRSPIETQSYELARFRVPFDKFDETLAVRRFDKVVEGLRFNSFQPKKTL